MALDFILKDNEELIGLIGGEPTLHPNFEEIVQLLEVDDRVKNIILFTNGIQLIPMKTTLKSLNSRILLNFISEKDTGLKYRSIIRNIDALCKEGYDLENRLALVLNIYSKEIRYDIFEVIKEFNIKFFRISLVAPNNCRWNNPRDYILEFDKVIKKYILH